MARSPSRICPVIVGRECELACGAALLTEAAAGRGQFLLLSGEAGIGKSRLARALTETATWRGFHTMVGVCQEQDRDCPYAPFLDALRFLLHRGGSDASAAIAGQDRAVLARLVPELGMAGDESVAVLPPEHEKRRIFEAFVHLCLALSRDTPLVIVLEDLHWADATSLDLIQLLARRLASARTFLLATTRSDEPEHDLAAWLSALERGRLVTRLALAPLTELDVAAMIAATAESLLPLPVVTAINARAEGNPFLVEELLQALVEDAAAEAARWDSSDGIIAGQVPAVVAQTIARRLDALDHDARMVAEVGAAIGRRFSFDLLRRLTELDEATLIGALRQLVAAHLVIEERSEARAVFAFRHALAREAIYHRLLEPERRRQHRRIARVFATETGDWPTPSDGELGYHYYAAGEWAAALVHCQRAGEQAQALYSPQAAIEHFSRALIAAERLSASRTGMLLLRGEAYEWIGDRKQARHDYETALAAARASEDCSAEWQAMTRLSATWAGGDHPKALRYAEDALALARAVNDAAATAYSLNRLGNYCFMMGRPFEARPYHQQALAIFESLNDMRGIADSLTHLGSACYIGADLIQGAAYHRRAVEAARILGDSGMLVTCLAGITQRGATLQGDWMVPEVTHILDALPEGEQALALARKSGWRRGESWSLSCLAFCVGAQGDYACLPVGGAGAADRGRDGRSQRPVHRGGCARHLVSGGARGTNGAASPHARSDVCARERLRALYRERRWLPSARPDKIVCKGVESLA